MAVRVGCTPRQNGPTRSSSDSFSQSELLDIDLSLALAEYASPFEEYPLLSTHCQSFL